MTTRAYYYLLSAISLLLFLTLVPLETQSQPNNANNPSTFLQSLEGCKKGERVDGLQNLKGYLTKLGYLENTHQEVSQNDEGTSDMFDHSLEKAIKMYQLYYKLNVTGYLDVATVKQMMKPR